MSSYRENILSQLDTDILKINVANGYNFNYNTSREFLNIEDIKLFPHICYFLGGETLKPGNEDESIHNCISEVMLIFYYSANNNESLIDVTEKVIADGKAFIHAWNSEHFDFSEIVDRGGNLTSQRLNIEAVDRYVLMDTSYAVMITAKLEYYETDGVDQFNPVEPPGAPSLLLPNDLSENEKIFTEFQWFNVSNATSYQIQVSDGSDFSSPNLIVNQEGLEKSSFTIPQDTAVGNTDFKYWRVRAKNSGGYGNWSNVRSYKTLPAVPVIEQFDSADDKAYIFWDNPTNADKFHLQLSDTIDFSNILIDIDDYTFSAVIYTLLSPGTYYFHVSSKNLSGESDYTTKISFTIV